MLNLLVLDRKTGATRCQILRLNATYLISPRATPQPPLEELQRSQDPLAVFKRSTSKERQGKEGSDRGERREMRRKGRGKGRQR